MPGSSQRHQANNRQEKVGLKGKAEKEGFSEGLLQDFSIHARRSEHRQQAEEIWRARTVRESDSRTGPEGGFFYSLCKN